MILGIETSTDTCGVALVQDGRPVADITREAPRQHSEMLLGLIEEVMNQAGVTGSGLEGLAVSQGPGSFTGLRVGMSLAKGLAYGWVVPLVGIPTLEVLAHQVAFSESPQFSLTTDRSPLIAVVINAQRHEVYTSVYQREGSDIREVKPAGIETPADLRKWLTSRGEGPWVVTGPGLTLHRTVFEGTAGIQTAPSEDWAPRASTVARLGERRIRAKISLPALAELAPLYLREPPITTPKPKKI